MFLGVDKQTEMPKICVVIRKHKWRFWRETICEQILLTQSLSGHLGEAIPLCNLVEFFIIIVQSIRMMARARRAGDPEIHSETYRSGRLGNRESVYCRSPCKFFAAHLEKVTLFNTSLWL
jgi:hypothetical protein